MEEQTAKLLTKELDEAIEHNDKDRYNNVMALAMKNLVDCQYKTSERVKKIEITLVRQRARLEGAQILWKMLKWAGALGGGAGVGYIVQALTATH